MRVKYQKSTKYRLGKEGSVIRYESLEFGMQEMFLQVETNIISENIKFYKDILDLFGERDVLYATDQSYHDSTEKERETFCPELEASEGLVLAEVDKNYDKISFGVIHISSISLNLTFSLNKDLFQMDMMPPEVTGTLGYVISNFA